MRRVATRGRWARGLRSFDRIEINPLLYFIPSCPLRRSLAGIFPKVNRAVLGVAIDSM